MDMIWIRVDGKNWNDLLAMECVREISKDSVKGTVVILRTSYNENPLLMEHAAAYIGDVIETDSMNSTTGTVTRNNIL